MYNINEKYFTCNSTDSTDIHESINNCENQIGYTTNYIGELSFKIISLLGFVSNFLLVCYYCIYKGKKEKKNRKKTSMRRLFGILPIIDCLISIYWVISSFVFEKLSKIQANYRFCSLISLFYIFIFTFQFVLINFLLYHFRKINTNPIEGILKPDKNVNLYILISIISSMVVAGITDLFKIMGTGPLNTCFINTEYAKHYDYIFFIPIILLIIAIIQIIHDLCYMKMFSADKGIRKLHSKNSLYVLIFCFFHSPMLVIIVYSILSHKNHHEDDKIMRISIQIVSIFTCLIPLLMSLIRQFQGITRFEFINKCIKKKKRKEIIRKTRTLSLNNLNNRNLSNETIADPFEWLENHVMEYFMRDILIGVATAIKKSEIYYDENGEISALNAQDFHNFTKHKIEFKNYCLNDETVKNSEYLDVKVIDYAPKCFAYLRKMENINIQEMIESFLPKNNKQGIKESQGKSGSFFISTDDNKYMIKTLKADEIELLKHVFLDKYITHIANNPNSLLCRLYGMYNIILGQGDEILIIVMRNVIGDFNENVVVKFDLKGSTYKRKANNFDMNNYNNSVMKDLDFNEIEKSIMLSETSIQKLRTNATNDSKFLCNLELMDYSLFLVKLTLTKEEASDTFGEKIQEKQDTAFLELMSSSNLDSNSQNEIININNCKMSYNGVGRIHDVTHYKQYLYPSLNKGAAYIISIIDYFQIFNFFKLMESGFKNKFQARKNTISCIEPRGYSSRFIKYINQLTDLKQIFINDSIKEEDAEEEEVVGNNDDESSDESDNENLITKKVEKFSCVKSFDSKNKKGSYFLLSDNKEENNNSNHRNTCMPFESMGISNKI